MPIIDGTKLACAACIRGHRSTSCQHTERPLFEVRKKGRPMTQCNHCRDLRKVKQVHVRCHCRPDPSEAPKRPVAGKGKKKGGETTPEEASCNCDDTGLCSCATPRSNSSKSDSNLHHRSRSQSTGSAAPSSSRPLRPDHRHQHQTSCCGRSVSPSCCSGHEKCCSSTGTPASSCCGNGIRDPSPASSSHAGSCCRKPADPPNSNTIPASSTSAPAPLFSASTNATLPSTSVNININMNGNMNPNTYLLGPSPFSPVDSSQPWASELTQTVKSDRYTPYPKPYLPIKSLGVSKDLVFPQQPTHNSFEPHLNNNIHQSHNLLNTNRSGEGNIPYDHSIGLWNQIMNSSGNDVSQPSGSTSSIPSWPPSLSSRGSPSGSTDTNTNSLSTNAKLCFCDPQVGCACGTGDHSALDDCAAMMEIIQQMCREMAKGPIVDLPYPIRKPRPQPEPQCQPQSQSQPQPQSQQQPKSRAQTQLQRLEQLAFLPQTQLDPHNNNHHPLSMGSGAVLGGDTSMGTGMGATGSLDFAQLFGSANSVPVTSSIPIPQPYLASSSMAVAVPNSAVTPDPNLNSNTVGDNILDHFTTGPFLPLTQTQTRSSSSSASFSYLPAADEAMLSQLEETLGLQPSVGVANASISSSTEHGDITSNCTCGPDCSCIICTGNTRFGESSKPCSACDSCASCVAIRQVVGDPALACDQLPSTLAV